MFQPINTRRLISRYKPITVEAGLIHNCSSGINATDDDIDIVTIMCCVCQQRRISTTLPFLPGCRVRWEWLSCDADLQDYKKLKLPLLSQLNRLSLWYRQKRPKGGSATKLNEMMSPVGTPHQLPYGRSYSEHANAKRITAFDRLNVRWGGHHVIDSTCPCNVAAPPNPLSIIHHSDVFRNERSTTGHGNGMHERRQNLLVVNAVIFGN